MQLKNLMNFFDFRCVLCQKNLFMGNNGICSQCNKAIERYTYCGCCGMPSPNNVQYCGYCLNSPPYWDHMIIIGHYAPPLSKLIQQFKFHNLFWLDKTLARLLLLSVYEARRLHFINFPDAIFPVPLSHLRQWMRGYNQADLIAGYLAKWLNIPYYPQHIQRIKNTPTQLGLNAKERKQNLKDAFALSIQSSKYHSIALVDDVITTGSTLNEVAKCFKTLGVQNIQVWGLARAYSSR